MLHTPSINVVCDHAGKKGKGFEVPAAGGETCCAERPNRFRLEVVLVLSSVKLRAPFEYISPDDTVCLLRTKPLFYCQLSARPHTYLTP